MSTRGETIVSEPKKHLKSISRLLLMISAIGTALSFGLLMFISSKSGYENAVEQSAQSNTVITELLAAQVAGGLRWQKSDVVIAVFESSVAAVENNTLANVLVYDSNNELWLEHTPESHINSGLVPSSEVIVGTEGISDNVAGAAYTVAVPILSGRDNAPIGTLVAVWDFTGKQATARQVLITSALLAVCFLGLLIVLQWWVIGRFIRKPLRRITAQMAQLASGDTNIEVVGQNRDDEIGAIASAVNVFKQDALEAIKVKQKQDAVEREADIQRSLAAKSEEEKQTEKFRQLEEQRARSEVDAKMAFTLKQRIEGLLRAVDSASKGDLSYPIEFGDEQDDLQKVSIALDNMFKELRVSFDQIGQRTCELTVSATELKALGGTISSIAGENNTKTSYASKTCVRVSESVESVTSATQQMGASIKQISLNASDATSVANRAVELAESTDVSIRQLAESSRGIGNVIKVINSIAKQTNLLALNATIEAARAGDAGKGFAVVANEVKELARETATATEEIENRIASIQTDTNAAVQAIESINKIVIQISETQGVIADSVEKQTTTTQEITRTMLETSQANDEINGVMDDVVAQSESARDSAGNVESAALQLGGIATSLDTLLQKFQQHQKAA